MLHEFSNIDKPLPKKEGSFLGKFGVGKFQFKKKNSFVKTARCSPKQSHLHYAHGRLVLLMVQKSGKLTSYWLVVYPIIYTPEV